MDIVATRLAQLKARLESTAFMVSKGESAKQVHSEIVQGLIILSEVEREYSSGKLGPRHSDGDSDEVKKVRRRLKLWARRQSQINSKILNAFLKLDNSGASVVRESDLRSELRDMETFKINFDEMKNIAERNHGKVFEQDGDVITLWGPVATYVREYEKTRGHG